MRSYDGASPAESPKAPRKPRKHGRWIALTIILFLFMLLAGLVAAAYFAYQQYPALNAVSLRICNDLVGQKYSDAYSLLSSRLRHNLSGAAFDSLSLALDATEGQVTSCGEATSGNPQPGVFPLSVTVETAITRTHFGQRRGSVKLIYENGHWVIDEIHASLLGANLDALLVVQSLCDDLTIPVKSDTDTTQKYTKIWALYSRTARAATTADFLALGKLHEAVDGKVLRCALTSIGEHNTDTQTQVQFTVARANADEMHAAATLRPENGEWKFTAIDARVYGRDMTPALAAMKWFAMLRAGNCSGAFAGLATTTQKRLTQATFTSKVCNASVDWSFYTIDPSGYYQVSASRYIATLLLRPPDMRADGGFNVFPGTPYFGNITLDSENNAWKVSALVL